MKWQTLRLILSRASLPMLALAASYGVFKYAELYVPSWVAFIQAAAFEAVYLGLAIAPNFSTYQQRRASAISGGAVVASVLYNTLAGLFHRIPLEQFNLPVYGELAFAALHGLPLAWVAYLVADLLLHSQVESKEESKTEVPTVMEQSVTFNVLAVDSEATSPALSKTAKVKQLAAQNGVSESTIWRKVTKGEIEV